MRSISAVSYVLLLLPLVFVPPASGDASFEAIKSVTLDKTSGQVDQVEARPGGGFAIRDYTWDPPEAQVIELFSEAGARESRIEGYGHGAGKYIRLKDLAVAPDGSLWVADFGASRATHYGENGEVLGTLLLQNPSYRPVALAVDSDSLYVAGCVAVDTYLNRGCELVHRYRLADRKFQETTLRTPEETVERGWAGRGGYDLDLAADGTLYFVHETTLTLFRRPPGETTFTAVEVESGVAKPPAPLTRDIGTRPGGPDELLAASFTLDRVVAGKDHTAVSIRRPDDGGYLLAVFDADGQQVARDVPAPGRLVGSGPEGEWIFVRKEGGGFVLDLTRVVLP